MSQEAAAEVPIVLPAQRGLRNCTGWPIFQTPSPPGGGASCNHGYTTLSASLPVSISVFISVSISKYFCLISLYLIYFIILFLLIRSYLWYTLFILYTFLFTRLFLFPICVYCYSKYSYPRLYFSFNFLIWSPDYCFILKAYYYYKFIFWSSSIRMLK